MTALRGIPVLTIMAAACCGLAIATVTYRGDSPILVLLPSLGIIACVLAPLVRKTIDRWNISALHLFYLLAIWFTFMNFTQEQSLAANPTFESFGFIRLIARISINALMATYFAVKASKNGTHLPWKLVIFYGVVTLPSIFMTENIVVSFGRWLDLFTFLGGVLALSSHSGRDFLLALFISTTAILIILWAWWMVDREALTVTIYWSEERSVYEASYRFGGLIFSPNYLGVLAASSLVVSFHPILTSKRVLRFVGIAGACLACVTVFATNSRTSIVAAAFAVLWIPVSQLLPTRPRWAVAISYAILIMITAEVAYLSGLTNLGVSLLSRTPNDTTIYNLTGRTELWKLLIPYIASHPEILGLGAGFASMPSGFGSVNGWVPSHAHNGLLQVLVGSGLLACIAFVWIYVRMLRDVIALQDKSERTICEALFVLFVIQNATESGAFVLLTPVTIPAGVLLVRAAIARAQHSPTISHQMQPLGHARLAHP